MKLAALLLMLVNGLHSGIEPSAAQPPEAGTGPTQELRYIEGTGLQASMVHGSGCDEPSQCATMRLGFEYDELSRVKTATRAQYASPGDVQYPEVITTRRVYNGRGQMLEERTEHGLGNIDVVNMGYDGVGRIDGVTLRSESLSGDIQKMDMTYAGVRLASMAGHLEHVSENRRTSSQSDPYIANFGYTGLANTHRTTRYGRKRAAKNRSSNKAAA